jgi:hypothetical protein
MLALALALVGLGLLAFLLGPWRRDKPSPSASNAASVALGRARAKDAPTLRVAVRSPNTGTPSKGPLLGADVPEDALTAGSDDPSDDSLDKDAIARGEANAHSTTGNNAAGKGEGAPQPKTGIAAFPAPGTKRIKPGLKVPEDFPLPPGYMRHYQATDKGLMLEPILVYHPDYELVDANGHVIPLPPDRVVPPDQAPEGLPVETLDVPTDAYADRDDHGPSTNADPGQTGVEEEKPAGDKP